MTIRDERLNERYSRALQQIDGCPPDQIQVCALMHCYSHFARFEGAECKAAREAIEHLLSAELRPALRDWYRGFGDGINPRAREFRELLSELAGERFG